MTCSTTTVYERDTIFDPFQPSFKKRDSFPPNFHMRNDKNKKKRDQCRAKPKPSNSTYSASLTSASLTSTRSAAPSSTSTKSNPLGSFPTDVISAACRCLASSTTVTDTVTITTTVAASPSATLTATVIVSPTLSTDVVTVTSGTVTATTTATAPGLTSTVETDVAAPTPATVTVTSTTTQAAPTTTVTAPNPYFEVSSEYYVSQCIPKSRRQTFPDVPGVPLTIDGIFQFCAARCAADAGCSKIWITHNRPITREGLWCVTGGAADNFDDLQCPYPGIGIDGSYYYTVQR
ncbi:hypothetical protein PG985_014264 [Apiospora marii]|uniref:uncharacterized protein n=1 Tax=Apiospora marii TaxID=335849 RepID=UPI00312DD24A